MVVYLQPILTIRVWLSYVIHHQRYYQINSYIWIWLKAKVYTPYSIWFMPKFLFLNHGIDEMKGEKERLIFSRVAACVKKKTTLLICLKSTSDEIVKICYYILQYIKLKKWKCLNENLSLRFTKVSLFFGGFWWGAISIFYHFVLYGFAHFIFLSFLYEFVQSPDYTFYFL